MLTQAAAPASVPTVPPSAKAVLPVPPVATEESAPAVPPAVQAATAAVIAPFDYREAQKTVQQCFARERSEDIPVKTLRTAMSALSDGDFKALMDRLDAENKVMFHAGTAYLI